jgi:hypothetical protein
MAQMDFVFKLVKRKKKKNQYVKASFVAARHCAPYKLITASIVSFGFFVSSIFVSSTLVGLSGAASTILNDVPPPSTPAKRGADDSLDIAGDANTQFFKIVFTGRHTFLTERTRI